MMQLEAPNNQWQSLDLWNAIPNQYFSEAVLHISPEGEYLLIQEINQALQKIACQNT